jgi:hypothetical protein
VLNQLLRDRTEGGSSGNGYTRVVVSLNHLSVATQFQYTTVSLASCGIKTTSYPNRALGCRQTLCALDVLLEM